MAKFQDLPQDLLLELTALVGPEMSPLSSGQVHLSEHSIQHATLLRLPKFEAQRLCRSLMTERIFWIQFINSWRDIRRLPMIEGLQELPLDELKVIGLPPLRPETNWSQPEPRITGPIRKSRPIISLHLDGAMLLFSVPETELVVTYSPPLGLVCWNMDTESRMCSIPGPSLPAPQANIKSCGPIQVDPKTRRIEFCTFASAWQ
jgi:hypothetical protein